MSKIGLGIVTHNRPDYFKEIIKHVPVDVVDELVIVNDGTPYTVADSPGVLIQHDTNKGVGVSKNDALRHLQSKGCEHFFLMEDDIIIKNKAVFEQYIRASKLTGIQHFNYSQHGWMNRKIIDNRPSDVPNPKVEIDYGDVEIALYMHCVGAFSYYSKRCLDEVGLIDERFFNACEHVDHTYQIIKRNMHPQFWWFADLANTNDFLADIPWSRHTSTISSRTDHNDLVRAADQVFLSKNGLVPVQIPQAPINEVQQKLKDIHSLR